MSIRWPSFVVLPVFFLASAPGAHAADRFGPTLTPPASHEAIPAYFKTGVLTFQDRVWAQTQIELVYYNHRIWPKENPGPKPPFEALMPRTAILAKVNDSLKKSVALETLWHRPVTGEILQSELDRMTSQTRDPEMLRELFGVLHGDPRLIAETLVREILSDILIRNAFAYDLRFHADAKAKADAIAHVLAPLARRGWREAPGEGSWKSMGGEYRHQIILADGSPARLTPPGESPEIQHVNAEEFTMLRNRYSRPGDGVFDNASFFESPDGDRTDLRHEFAASDRPRSLETPEHFIFVRLMDDTNSRIEIATILVPKASFSKWWEVAAADIQPDTKARSISGGMSFSLPERFATQSTQGASSCDTWSFEMTPFPSTGNAGSVWTGSEMLLYSGTYPNVGYRYNPVTDRWSPITTNAQSPGLRSGNSVIWSGTEMIVWGGYFDNTGARYNPATDSWQSVTLSGAPTARRYHTAVWAGGGMIVWGGENGAGTGFNTGGRYLPTSDSWLPVAMDANTPSGRFNHAAVWTGTEMIVWGGESSGTKFNSGGRYNPSTDSWSMIAVSGTTPSARKRTAAVWTGTRMILWGGDSGLPAYSGGIYDPQSDSWQSIGSLANQPANATSHKAVWTGNEVIVWGGDWAGGYNNRGGRYNPISNTWSAMSVGANVPAGRVGHEMIWTGQEVIIWGGYGSYGTTLYGGRYSPTDDSWIPIFNGINIPAKRSYQSMIWTGSEMIVWGGYSFDVSGYLSSGSRYDPATAAWAIMHVDANTPSGRRSHSATWTGSEMIVWGGSTASGAINTGGRYNPLLNSWTPTSVGTNVPASRSGHTAVWDGSKLIVWGGANSTELNSGGLYSPASDSWSPTSIGTNVPVARYGHTAVWAGDRMVVWGGEKVGCTGCHPNVGGRYFPTTDIWLPTAAPVGMPSSRQGAFSAWTGTEMLITGGNTTGTGGRYNPVSDSWVRFPSGQNPDVGSTVWSGKELISWGTCSNCNTGYRFNPYTYQSIATPVTQNVPSPRSQQSAVWAGNRMLIWGGAGDGTGGTYNLIAPQGPANSLHLTKPGSVALNWSASSDAAFYNVRQCNPTISGCTPATIISSPTLNQYSEPDDGISHFYAVEAVNQCGATP